MGQLSHLIDGYHKGTISQEGFIQQAADFPYNTPARVALQHGNNPFVQEDYDYSETDTWDELRHAVATGKVDAPTYLAIAKVLDKKERLTSAAATYKNHPNFKSDFSFLTSPDHDPDS